MKTEPNRKNEETKIKIKIDHRVNSLNSAPMHNLCTVAGCPQLQMCPQRLAFGTAKREMGKNKINQKMIS